MSTVQTQAVQFDQFGEPLDVLSLKQVEVPDPGAGQIRVRVAATALNPADWELCRGFMAGALPRGIGYDVAGTVQAVGDGVRDVAVGDAVFGASDFAAQPSAGAAGSVILSAWFPIPSGLDAVQAAALPMEVQTAVWTLDLMKITPGEQVLVHGAGGMVGYTAVQVALRRGARVIATAGPTFAADLEQFGAVVTSYGDGMIERVQACANGPIHHILDTSKPQDGTIASLVAIAGDAKRVVTISNHDEARAQGARVNVDELVAAGGYPSADFLSEYATLVAAGEFAVPIARTFPLADWRAAAELSLSGSPHGKLVLIP